MSPTDRLPLVDRADPRLSIVAQCRLLKIAPVSQEMVLNSIAEHVLGLPRSF